MTSSNDVLVLPDARRLLEGDAVTFVVHVDGIARDAFVVRYRGGTYAYLNTCRHQFQRLDFGDAHFFDDAYNALVCCHHGARYEPATGACVEGPCVGARLTAVELEARGDQLWCTGVRARTAP